MIGTRYVCTTCGSDLFAQWREGDGYRCRKCGGYTPMSAMGLPNGWSARPPLDGTWTSPGYRSANTRALAAMWLLVVVILITAAAAVVALRLLPYFNGRSGGYFPGDAVTLADLLALLGALQTIAMVVTGLAFVAWLSRAVEATPALGLGTPSRSPREAIGWWFVPIANLFIPFQIIRDLHRRVSLGRGGTGLIVTWWVFFMVTLTFDRLLGGASGSVLNEATNDPWSTIRVFLVLTTVSEIGLAVSGVLGVFVIDGARRAQLARAAAVGAVDVSSQAVAWSAQVVSPQVPQPTVPAAVPPAVAPLPAPASPPSDAANASEGYCPRCGRPRSADGSSSLRFCRGCGLDFDAVS